MGRKERRSKEGQEDKRIFRKDSEGGRMEREWRKGRKAEVRKEKEETK